MEITKHHAWECTTDEARKIQNELSQAIVLRDKLALTEIRYIAGIDNAYTMRGNQGWVLGVVVILRYPGMDVVEVQTAVLPVRFPYVPGLLSFREAPAILAACKKTMCEPDILMFDGQGYAHPRRIGLASHLGLVLNKPSIGVAKSRLVGVYEEPGPMRGDFSKLSDHQTGELIGYVLRTKMMRKPIFVSPGHQVGFETALQFTLNCLRENHSLPEPVRQAHLMVTKMAREFQVGDVSEKLIQ